MDLCAGLVVLVEVVFTSKKLLTELALTDTATPVHVNVMPREVTLHCKFGAALAANESFAFFGPSTCWRCGDGPG